MCKPWNPTFVLFFVCVMTWYKHACMRSWVPQRRHYVYSSTHVSNGIGGSPKQLLELETRFQGYALLVH